MQTRKKKASQDGLVPEKGITVEFFYSTSANFDLAVETAKKFNDFHQFGKGKKAMYRVTFGNEEMDLAIELGDFLKGWRKKTLYVDGEKVTWNAVFEFVGCYKGRSSSYRPAMYCFGYEEKRLWNLWGCLQAEMPFTSQSKWLTWGRWVDNSGTWEFDKNRIRHELLEKLLPYRFCPAIQMDLVDHVLSVFPDRVNPNEDPDWLFIESNDLFRSGLDSVDGQLGPGTKKVAIGVAPRGPEILERIMRKLKKG